MSRAWYSLVYSFASQPFPEKFPDLWGPNKNGIFCRYNGTGRQLYFKFIADSDVDDMVWYWTPYDANTHHWTHIKVHESIGGKLEGTKLEEHEEKRYIDFLETGPIPPHVMKGTPRESLP